MTHPTFQTRIEALYRQSSVTYAGTVVAGLVVLGATWALPQAHLAIVWFFAVFALSALRYALSMRQLRRGITQRGALRSAWWFATGALASGVLWGAFGVAAFEVNEPVYIVFAGFILGGMASGALGSLSVFLPAYALYAIPAVVPYAVLALTSGVTAFQGVGALSLVFVGVNLGYARGLNRTVQRAIELQFENARLLEDVARQRDLAEQASANKSLFLAAATHDMHQPAYAAGLFVGQLTHELAQSQGPHGDSPVSSTLRDLRFSVESLNAMLTGLIEHARLDGGRRDRWFASETKAGLVDLASLASQIVDMLRPSAHISGLVLRLRVSNELDTRVSCDPVDLQRLIQNLVQNALKFTERGGVLVTIRPVRGKIRLAVWDTGRGIKPTDLPGVFDDYSQLSNSNSVSGGARDFSLGLGLSIVNKLCARMGVDVCVRSEFGRGSVFSCDFSRVQDKPAEPLNLLVNKQTPNSPNQSALPPPRARSVLVVDDDAFVRRAVTSTLERVGHEVLVAANAQEATALLQMHAVDVLLADFDLGPDSDSGAQLIASAMAAHPCLVACLITGDARAASSLGVNTQRVHVLRKPLSEVELLGAVQTRARLGCF